MILYFDSYITDVPLNKTSKPKNDYIRNSSSSYSMVSKIDIAKYTLSSYDQYDWSHVFIKYELDNDLDYEEFDRYVLELFPKAIILHRRSNCFKDFSESLKVINKLEDDWIFYAGNNDQPWIGQTTTEYINELVSIANRFKNKYEYISICYTHHVDTLNLVSDNSPMNLLYGRDIMKIEDNIYAKVILRKQGDNTSAQIVNKKLFTYWFSTIKYPDEKIIRTEDIRKLFITKNQLMIIPKKEICAHFDGYVHTIGKSFEIADYQIPPLFIPNGFFSGKIKICYGYEKYRHGWVNINPVKQKYIFESLDGTDLKIELKNLPIFWKDKISEIDINDDIDEKLFSKYIKSNDNVRMNPWNLLNKNLSWNTLSFAVKYLLLFVLVKSSLVKITHKYNERRDYLKKIYSLLRCLKKYALS